MNQGCGSLPTIEVFSAENYFLFVKNDSSLWFDKPKGKFVLKPEGQLTSAPQCIGTCFGIIGKVELSNVLEPKVLVIKQYSSLGNGIFKIRTISFLQSGAVDALPILNICSKHHQQASSLEQKSPFAKTLGVMRSASNTIKTSTQQAAKIISRDSNKYERRILEELNKIFNDTDSFYFSLTSDITNCLQRQSLSTHDPASLKSVDDRFFWNKFMVQDIINLQTPECEKWIIPIIQGYVETEMCKVETESATDSSIQPTFVEVELSIISRRSRYRAGTRYKRRGVDENGHCANYVETEQLIRFQHHTISFVQTRGSVPVFWSQPGYKYRPPPTLLKGPAETQAVFNKHFAQEVAKYGPVCVVNLVEQNGKEKVIFDAYTNHMLVNNDPNIIYCIFDFHEYCRGMRFENVSYLVESLSDVIRSMGYCWADKQGLICEQKGIFRVNCIDCLDRTNVVQTALGKAVLEMQLTKLGLLPPEGQLAPDMRVTFQQLWANNGDVISRQYAGTNALKGDYTRTGERKLTGLMKDGMNSANRYFRVHFLDSFRLAALDIMQGLQPEPIDYLNEVEAEAVEVIKAAIPDEAPPPSAIKHVAMGQEMQLVNLLYLSSRYYLSRFKDSHRQATIDVMQGNEVSEDVFADKATDDEDAVATAEHVKLLLEDCKKMLINDPAQVLGCWGLIDADPVTGDPTETEMDTILILTKYAYYVAEYDEQVDRVSKYQRVSLRDVRSLEVGSSGGSVPISVFKKQSSPHCFRIHYVVDNEPGYYHAFRSTGLRFFNSVAVQINSSDEMLESLKAISETFLVALEIAGLPCVPIIHGKQFDKTKTKTLNADNTCRLGSYLDVSPQGMTRNISETQMVNLKSAGTKALSNISQQFSKMGRLGQSFRRSNANPQQNKEKPPTFSIDAVEGTQVSPSSTDSSESCADVVNIIRSSKHWHVPAVGILMGAVAPPVRCDHDLTKSPLFHANTQVVFDPKLLTGAMKIAENSKRKIPGKMAVPVNQKNLSHSSENVDNSMDRIQVPVNLNLRTRSSSEKNLTLNLASSQSESALKSLKNNLATVISSPANATKDMLSPLSKLAKGVHNFGATLDPRKLKPDQSYRMSQAHLEEIRLLQDRWRACSIKLIAL